MGNSVSWDGETHPVNTWRCYMMSYCSIRFAPVQARWLHQRPEERLGRYIPARGADGHMQYIPRC